MYNMAKITGIRVSKKCLVIVKIIQNSITLIIYHSNNYDKITRNQYFCIFLKVFFSVQCPPVGLEGLVIYSLLLNPRDKISD